MRRPDSPLTYANVMSTLAVLLVIGGGGAYAANTVFSSDIVDGEVRNRDLDANSVQTGKVANNNLTGIDIADGSLTGSDVDESTLQVPSGPLGRWQGGTACDPESTAFIDCGFVTLNLPAQSRVHVTGAVGARPEGAGDDGHGGCRVATSLNTNLAASEVTVLVTDGSLVNQGAGTIPLTVVTPPLGPGTVDFGIECNEAFGAIQYHHIQVSAVAISPG
jgi:hypothetical protein